MSKKLESFVKFTSKNSISGEKGRGRKQVQREQQLEQLLEQQLEKLKDPISQRRKTKGKAMGSIWLNVSGFRKTKVSHKK